MLLFVIKYWVVEIVQWVSCNLKTGNFCFRFLIFTVISRLGRSQWPHGLMRRSAAAWLLGSRVLITLGAWMFVCCVYTLCCPVWVEVSATGWSLVQRSPTVCLCMCDQETPKMEANGPSWTISACEWMSEYFTTKQARNNISLSTYVPFKVTGSKCSFQNEYVECFSFISEMSQSSIL
jgi:hypothetical protein